MTPLPRLMVAPNGARLSKDDHPAIPVTLPEIVSTARDCHAAGADGLHLHLRDNDGAHILDAGFYREAITELTQAVPGLAIQVTTEAVGKYSADHQREIALNSGAHLVSTSIREIMTDTGTDTVRHFFRECQEASIALQFILYDLTDLELLKSVLPTYHFTSKDLQVLFVLGRYSTNRDSSPADLRPFLDEMQTTGWQPDWGVCAFGKGETSCLDLAWSEGGKLRVGFENSFWSANGTLARDNAQRVREIAELMQNQPATLYT